MAKRIQPRHSRTSLRPDNIIITSNNNTTHRLFHEPKLFNINIDKIIHDQLATEYPRLSLSFRRRAQRHNWPTSYRSPTNESLASRWLEKGKNRLLFVEGLRRRSSESSAILLESHRGRRALLWVCRKPLLLRLRLHLRLRLLLLPLLPLQPSLLRPNLWKSLSKSPTGLPKFLPPRLQ